MDTFRVLDFKFTLLFVILCELSCVCFGQDTFYFNLKPTNQAVIEGTEQTLLCDVSNRRHIQFHWIHNSKPITNTSRRFQDGSNLRILRVTRDEDSGPFQCIATNITTGFSLQSGEAALDIQWIDPVASVELKKVKDEEFELGSDIQLKCQIEGNPQPTYSWYHNKYKVPVHNRLNVKLADSGTRLKISGLTASDNGVYSCQAKNIAGTVDSSSNYLLNVQVPNSPHLIEEQFTPYKLVVRGDDARLDCPFVNATKIEWYATYEKLTNTSRHTIFNNGSLYFPKVRKPDEGGYRCEGHNENPEMMQLFTADIYLAYLDDFGVNTFEPRLIPSYPMVVPVHEPFTVRTFIPNGRPSPSHRWLNKNDMPIGETGAIRVIDSNLFFEDPEQIDSGNYTFIVNNTAGEKIQSVWIVVSVSPTIRRSPQPREVGEGADVEFNCQVVGTPYPVTSIIWQKDDEFIKLGSPRHYMNRETGTLRISMVTEEDRGEYFCIANTTGQKLVRSLAARLRVKRKLKFNPIPQNVFLELDSDAEVHCRAEAEVNPRVNWIKGNGQNANVDFSPHIIDADGTLYFRGVQRKDAGAYTCVAIVPNGRSSDIINKTIYISVVEKPKFQIPPFNTTAYEEHSIMLHCVATGDPRPMVIWDKDGHRDIWDTNRFMFYPNGSLFISRVYMQDQGLYTCTANNSAGTIHAPAFIYVASGSDYTAMNDREDEEGFDMMRTVIIAVCSAGAYLALVIGLTAYCSYRLLLQRRNRKAILAATKQNGNMPTSEQHELLMKDGDRESGATHGCRSDSDNRSHVSALSSHPSHSSHSASHSNSQTQSQNLSQQSTRSAGGKSNLDRMYFPRHELQTIGILGKSHYGDVFLAKARGIRIGELETQVLVKSLLLKEDQHYYEFQREVDMYSKLDHNNVLKLLGVCCEAEPLFYIAEYCDWGDLKQFLMASRVDSNGRRRIPPFTILQKIGMCNQVALGMEHLSNNRMVHRDLATRNVLLTSRLELKISHMALSRDSYASEYVIINNQTALPLRWLSPEAVLEADYSTKSDVWAYGVFMWEVIHLADIPHQGRSDEELLKGLKAGDVSLEFSEHCPNEMIDLVRKCTAENPKDRPNFTEIHNSVAELVQIYSQPQYQSTMSPAIASFPSITSYNAHEQYMT